jgi:hypothetical protein
MRCRESCDELEIDEMRLVVLKVALALLDGGCSVSAAVVCGNVADDRVCLVRDEVSPTCQQHPSVK